MSLLYYKKLFANLGRNPNMEHREGEKSPNKPILLLSLLQAIEIGALKENCIHFNLDLKELFSINWRNIHGVSGYHCNIIYPFYHLKTSGFWQLVANSGYEKTLETIDQIRTKKALEEYVAYAKFNDDLFELLQDKNNRLELVQLLLKTYFSSAKAESYLATFEIDTQFYDYSYKSPEQLKLELEEESNKEMKDNEEIKIRKTFRDARFTRNVLNAYQNRCSISNLTVTALADISMLDACHILPFKESYNNNIENGFALCPNLHRAFDRGLITVDKNYKIIVSHTFKENEASNYNIRQFEGKKLLLPNNKLYYPKIEYFEEHKERFKHNF